MISYKEFKTYEGFRYRDNFSRLSNMDLLAKTITSCCWSPIVWKNNNRLSSEFFRSDFLVLDFDDEGPETLEEVNHSLRDHKRIIATTKSHGVEKNGLVCDRYRLIIPFEQTISSYDIYKATYIKALKQFYWADQACHDGARFFFPCREVRYIDRDHDKYCWPVEPLSVQVPYIRPPVTGRIPGWCLRFLNDGEMPPSRPSRNLMVFSVATEMFRQGFDERFIRSAVLMAPIKWSGVSLESILKSAKKKGLESV